MALAGAARWYCRLLLVATVSAASDSSGSASDSDDCSGSSSGSSSGSGPKFYQLPIVDGVGARDFWIIFSMMIAFIIIVDRLQFALDMAVKGDRCLEKLLARVYAELLVFGIVACGLLFYTVYTKMSDRMHKIFELVDIMCTLGAMLVVVVGIFMFNFLHYSHRLYERQMMASTRVKTLLHAEDVDGAADVLKANNARVGLEEVADHMLSSTAFKWDYQLPEKFRFHVYLREMLAQAVCDVIDISWITWMVLLIPGLLGILITGIEYPNEDDDTSWAARITITLACVLAGLAVATSFVCHYNLRVLRRSLGLSVACADAHFGLLCRLRCLCGRSAGRDHSDWAAGLHDRFKTHLDTQKTSGSTAAGSHPATAHFVSHHKRVTQNARRGMLVLCHGEEAFYAFRLWLQFIVVAQSMLLALYLLHFRVNVTDISERLGFLLSTCLSMLISPDIIFVQGMIEAYTLPRAEVIDAVMHDEHLFEEDLAHIHQHVDLLLDKPHAHGSLSRHPSLSNGSPPKTRRTASVAENMGRAMVRLDAAFHLAPHGHGSIAVLSHLAPGSGKRDDHNVLREILREIDAPISLERLRRLERFLDSSSCKDHHLHDEDGTPLTPEQTMMRRLRITPEEVEQLRARREARLVSESEGGVLRSLSNGHMGFAPAAAPATLKQGPEKVIASTAV